MRHFCTYFDHGYLSKGLALYASLKRHCPAFQLHVLCLSDECCAALRELALPGMTLVTLPDLEGFEPRLLEKKKSRSRMEYYFTCSPVLPLYLIRKYPDMEMITYLDADTFLFSSPEEVFDEIGRGSVAIVPHRFPARLKHLEQHGRFNVGWLTFRNDEGGIRCLEWYRDRCLEWCRDIVDADRYADQRYLDQFSSVAKGVVEIAHPGCDLAPWNLEGASVLFQDGGIIVNGRRLVLYHFEGLKQVRPGWYDLGSHKYGIRVSPIVRTGIYKPYLQELVGWQKRVGGLVPASGGPSLRKPPAEHSFSVEMVLKLHRGLRTMSRAFFFGSLLRYP